MGLNLLENSQREIRALIVSSYQVAVVLNLLLDQKKKEIVTFYKKEMIKLGEKCEKYSCMLP